MAIQQTAGSDQRKTVEEAADQPGRPAEDTENAKAGVGDIQAPAGKRSGRHLIIRVSEGGVPKANVRIPLGLARAAAKFIPHKEKEQLKAEGIDVEELLGELTGDEIGPLVQVEEDGRTVWVAVE